MRFAKKRVRKQLDKAVKALREALKGAEIAGADAKRGDWAFAEANAHLAAENSKEATSSLDSARDGIPIVERFAED